MTTRVLMSFSLLHFSEEEESEEEEEDEKENKENGETDGKKSDEGTSLDYPMARCVHETFHEVHS